MVTRKVKMVMVLTFATLFVATVLVIMFMSQTIWGVKVWGGTRHIGQPKNMQHIATQWHEDSIWNEYYNPINNTCVFQENTIGVIQGTIIVDDCNYRGIVK